MIMTTTALHRKQQGFQRTMTTSTSMTTTASPLPRKTISLLYVWFEEKIQWVRDNDEEARRIAMNGLELSKVYTLEQYKCYVFKLISLYAKLFVSEEQY